MTVKQLINYLKDLPKDVEVLVLDTYQQEGLHRSKIKEAYAPMAIGYSQDIKKVIAIPDWEEEDKAL